jgi:hypothetical protein
MTRTLAWISAGGLGGGTILLLVAFAIGGRELVHEASWNRWWSDSCRDSDVAATPGAASERSWPWNGGSTVEIAGAGQVRLRPGEVHEIVARGNPAALSNLDVRHRRVVIKCGAPGLEITLPAEAMHRLTLAGATRATIVGLAQPELELRVAGSGQVEGAGTVDQVTVTVAGSGNVRFANVSMKTLNAHLSGSGSVEAAPTDLANIRISGSGDVRLRSHPTTLRSKISGSGRIIQPSAEPADKKL